MVIEKREALTDRTLRGVTITWDIAMKGKVAYLLDQSSPSSQRTSAGKGHGSVFGSGVITGVSAYITLPSHLEVMSADCSCAGSSHLELSRCAGKTVRGASRMPMEYLFKRVLTEECLDRLFRGDVLDQRNVPEGRGYLVEPR
ncbi:glutamyl-tRNA(Gln) amidotransferase subunit B, chloroplastic/mitochondrial [Dorcoceras hygrometricum]|uniref:Glutamyl-tRNA(Gln) amidotransferase subunit B, chloroplastic/mitochondrial n=1 Tax=Dorcoceras hygrometricum TaxID=472368 RepID=A0A2Z7ADP2_9LAMI|nr:glutamyl-tRNA(Gln) amidotransferase subunit B, chloroplastic/mitochondrial [Dorcoceras hygrometricum]